MTRACWSSVVPRITLEWHMLLSSRADGRPCDIWNGQRMHDPQVMLEDSCGRITPQTRYVVRLPSLHLGSRRNQQAALNPSGNTPERRIEWNRLRYGVHLRLADGLREFHPIFVFFLTHTQRLPWVSIALCRLDSPLSIRNNRCEYCYFVVKKTTEKDQVVTSKKDP